MSDRQRDITERYVMLQCLRHRKRMNNMSKNISNVKAVDMTTVNAKDMKAITLSFEKFGFLRNVTAEEAGEFLQVILGYAMTGNMPEFKDKYQKMYYQSYFDVITEQMITATKRADNLRKNAKERADAVKVAKKIIAKQSREAKGVTPSSTSTDVDHVTISQTMSDTKRDVTSRSLFDNEDGTYNAEEASHSNVNDAEDLTYAYLLSLGVKKDTSSFNGEMTWNAMSDDAKRSAISYAKSHFSGKGTSANMPYASQFLKSKPWLNASK